MLFVGMGLGKTASVLWSLNDLFRDCESTGALVVAPKRVASLTWPMEVSQWEQFAWMKVADLRTKEGQRDFLKGTAHIYTINYESIDKLVKLIRQRVGTNREITAADLPFDTVIFDESTKAKNPKAKRIQHFRIEVPIVKRRWALTGTPAPNSLLDIFAQVRLVDGGERLGHSFTKFKKQNFIAEDWNGHDWKPREGAEQTIEQKIADITLTLLSKDWLDIPDANVEDVEVPFTHELKKQYNDLESELVLELEDEVTINPANAAALLNKLLQFTSGAMYHEKTLPGRMVDGVEVIDKERLVAHLHNLKLDALYKIVKEAKGEPVMVAVNFKFEQERIRRRFPMAAFMDDFATIESQKQLMVDWNAKRIPMLVLHPASAGHGLNFQYGCSRQVWTSLTYNREFYEQTIGRLARTGQKEVVTISRLMTPGTVDEAIATILQDKRDNENRLLSALKMLEAYRHEHPQSVLA